MKLAGSVLLVAVAGLACCDTLDYSNWSIRLAARETVGTTVAPGPELSSRGLKLLLNALYDDNQSVGDYLLMNPKIGRKLDQLHLQATQAGNKFLSDGTVSTEYGIPLTGQVLQTLMPKTGGGVPVGPMSCPICGQPWPEDKEVPPGITLIPLEEGAPTNYTGVLIDARGSDLNPALFPRILNQEGRIVYGPEFFLPTYASDRGSVGYYDQMSGAYADDRAGYNPLRITALRAAGRNSTDLIISDPDAKKLHGSLENLKLLERCRVIILTD